MKHFFWVSLLLLCCPFTEGVCQEFHDRQELIRQLSITPEDTNKVLLYISIGQQYENNLPDSAIHYYLQSRDLSEQLDYKTGILKFISNITYVYNIQTKYDTALQLNLKAVELAKSHGNSRQLGACLGNVANSYLYLEQYENAIDYFLLASDAIGKSGNKQYQCVLFNNLSIIYHKLKQPEKAVEFAKKAVKLARDTEDPYNLGISLDNLALSQMEAGLFHEALINLEEGLKIANETENIYVKESILINLADTYRRLGKFEKIKQYADEGLQLSRELEDISGEAIASLSLGYYYFYRNELNESSRYAQESEKLSASINSLEIQGNAVRLLGDIALLNRDFQSFNAYQLKADSISNKAVNEQILNNIQELEAKYESQKKIQQINQLEQEKAIQELKIKQNRFVQLILAVILFTFMIVGFLVFRSYRQKKLILEQEKELQEKRIGELETEKLLAAAEAALQGQDEERTRLARDLHDGLGGMLSGIKLSFINLKDLLAKRPQDQQLFDRNLDMLDGSVTELRRVAHNLMPETLLKFGLDTAISDYCDRITDSGTMQVTYQSIKLQKLNTDQTTQVTIYRIVQELINNIVRHAGASKVYVQLAYHEDHLTISVEDDGGGFDVKVLNDSPGIGWRNIRNRVDFLKGTIDVQSEKNKGTEVQIDILV